METIGETWKHELQVTHGSDRSGVWKGREEPAEISCVRHLGVRRDYVAQRGAPLDQ